MADIPLLPFPMVTQGLSNGLTVIVVKKPDHLVSVVLAIRGGAKNDKKLTGTAHALEHVNFKDGIHPALRDVYRHGLRTSAGTYYHYTNYSVKAPREFLGALIAAVLDMGFGTAICTPEEFVREQRSIEQELREWQDRDLFPLWVARHLYPDARWLHRSIIGTPDSVKDITMSHLLAHQARYSVCQNAVLVVVGDANEGEICDRALASTMPQQSGQRAKPLCLLPLRPVETVYVDPLSTSSKALLSFTGCDDLRQNAGLMLLSRMLEDSVMNPLYKTLQKHGAIYGLDAGHQDWPKEHQLPNWPDRRFTLQAMVRPEHFALFKDVALDALRDFAKGSCPNDLFHAVMNNAKMDAVSPLSADQKLLGEAIAQAWVQGESIDADRQALLFQMMPDDLAAAATFLLSGKPSFISVMPRNWKN